jgi:glycosyltransferase involved in cell wall biosynthesis
LLKQVFDDADLKEKSLNLITNEMPYGDFMKLMRESYAIILVSLGDISPHMILDAIRWNKPFILTKENGLLNRIKDIALLVDPKDKDDIKEKIMYLLDKDNYTKQVEKIKNFNFIHTWDQIGREIIKISNNVKN